MSFNQPPPPGYRPMVPPPAPVPPVIVRKGFPIWLALVLAGVMGIGGCTVGIGIGATGSRAGSAALADSTPSPTAPPPAASSEPPAKQTTAPKSADPTSPKPEPAKPSKPAAPKETKKPEPKQPAPEPEPAAETVTKRQWAKVVKNPEAYKGKRFIIFGEVTQFDSATGTDTFRADTAHANTTSYGYFDGANTMITGTAGQLDDVVEDDVFRASVTVLGKFDYETTLGGSTTVPHLQLNSIKVIGNND